MKKLRIILLVGLILTIGSCSTKRELTDLKKAYSSQQAMQDKYKQQNQSLKSDLATLKSENADLEKENTFLKKELKSTKQMINEISEQESNDLEDITNGLVYKVQIGAYRNRSLPDKLTKSENIDTEKKRDLQRIVVGQFRDYGKAKTLCVQLRAMGVKDAFIVPYIDNQRKSLEAVLSELGIEK